MGRVKSFDAVGSATSPSLLATNVLFTGRVFDVETGLYYFRARYFEPELGVFISRDPLGFVDGKSVYQGHFISLLELDPFGLVAAATTIFLGLATTQDPRGVYGTWTPTSATASVNALKSAMSTDGNTLGVNLFNHFLTGGGAPYVFNAAESAQVKNEAHDFMQGVIENYLTGKMASCPANINIDIPRKAPGAKSATTYDFMPTNTNMFVAIGGFRMSVSGGAKRTSIDRNYGLFCDTLDCCYDINVKITMDDKFAFGTDPAIWAGSPRRMLSVPYNAGVYLETNGLAKAFDWKLTYDDTFKICHSESDWHTL